MATQSKPQSTFAQNPEGASTTNTSGETPKSSPPRLTSTPSGMSPASPLRRAFISGPLAPPSNYFKTHYKLRIDTALANGDAFILGPSRGIDNIALTYLRSQNCPPSRMTVYFTHFEFHRTLAEFRRELQRAGIMAVAVGRNHDDRDEAMTKASDYDILRYLTKDECRAMFGARYRERISGTEKNEKRRAALLGLSEKVMIQESDGNQ